MKLSTLSTILLATAVITGCSTSQDELLPNGDCKMIDIYRGGCKASSDNGESPQTQGNLQEARNALQFVRPIHSVEADINEMKQYTRTAANEAKNLFPRLPNPDLTIYVFPHLSSTAEPVPIPGYTTVIPFYGRVQYAQPGERTANY